MNTIIKLFASILATLSLVAGARAQHSHTQLPSRSAPYSAHTLELAESLPVQDGGRVKPLSTYASFTLLRFNGKSSCKTVDGTKLDATSWLLDVLFYPEQAAEYPVFKVDDIQAIEAIGLKLEGKKKRDRYTFNEIRPAISTLFERAREYGQKEERDRSTVEQQVFTLATSIDDYIRLRTHFDFAREPQSIADVPALVTVFGKDSVSFSELMTKLPELVELQGAWRNDPARGEDSKRLVQLVQTASEYTSGTETLALIPPITSVKEEEAWHSPADLFMAAFEKQSTPTPYIDMLAAFEKLALSSGDPLQFEMALATVHNQSVAKTMARGEYEKIPLEISYYKAQFITNSLVLFLIGFLFAAGMWLLPRVKALYWGATLSVVGATALVVGAIVVRCMIRERPPVSTLYETLLFVAGVGAVTLLVIEWINKQRMALSVAAVLGMVLLLLANGYETLDKRDTMPQLIAVLDTNFWLATHVTAITAGYAAGLVAAAIANVYLVTRLFGIKKNDPTFAKLLSRMTYGSLAFALIFSVVGTILGGIWANESWGRFWGWDPKENGALMICLAQLVIMHARMGGYLREFGLAAATAFQGTVIAFSWFGVNLLGVGLHSYGFTSGIHTALWSYYGVQWGLVAVCVVHYLVQRTREDAVKQALATRGGGPAIPTTQGRAE
ncbi:MAG: cytochrome c biogenesis protein CcsA [Planctomycetes bacterium]|nr:cytochrome c biogenesis protein CcsA [Planctomycetota bacterium]